jgi:EmrB/QacA subfamily drug resistance transporter
VYSGRAALPDGRGGRFFFCNDKQPNVDSIDIRAGEVTVEVPSAHNHNGGFSRRDKVLALTGTLVALFMAGLDQTIVATAGPEIQRELQIPASLYAWITTAYLVASTVMLPIYGKLSDLYGRKPILLTGVGLFLFGSLLCGVAHSTGFLIAARVVQGLGSASLFTTTLAVIADLFPPQERGKYMGLIGVVMGISSIAGPIAGGIITDTLGWNWVFFINLPVGLVATWLIVTRMPSMGGSNGRKVNIDYKGAAWLVVGTVPLILAVSIASGSATAAGWTSPTVLGMLAVAVVGVAGFIRVERAAPDPIIDLRLFKTNVVVARTVMTMFVLGATFLFTVIFLPLFLVNVRGETATGAGLILAPLTFAMVATSVTSGQIASRFGHLKRTMLIALSILSVAFFLLYLTLDAETTRGQIIALIVMVGLGMGPTLPLYTLLVQNAAQPHQIGVVTSTSIFSRSVGQVIGLAFFGAIFAATLMGTMSVGTPAAVADVPATIQPHLQLTVGEGSGEGGASVHFDAEAVRERIQADATLSAAEQSAALAGVDRVEKLFADSLAAAISRLYLIGCGLTVLALVLTARIPVVDPKRN